MIHSMRSKCLGTQNPKSSAPALANFVFSDRGYSRRTETSAQSQVPWKHGIELTYEFGDECTKKYGVEYS